MALGRETSLMFRSADSKKQRAIYLILEVNLFDLLPSKVRTNYFINLKKTVSTGWWLPVGEFKAASFDENNGC
jgi:hypothetical protein